MAVVSAIIVNGARNSLLPENGWVKDVSDLVEVACGHEPKTLRRCVVMFGKGKSLLKKSLRWHVTAGFVSLLLVPIIPHRHRMRGRWRRQTNSAMTTKT